MGISSWADCEVGTSHVLSSSSVMMLMASAGRGAFCAFVDVFYVVKMCVVCINILYKLHEAHNYMGLYFHAT